MSEFEAVTAPPREWIEESAQSFGVRYKIWRQLKQDGACLRGKQAQAFLDQGQTVDGIGRETFPVSDELGCLPGEHEIMARFVRARF